MLKFTERTQNGAHRMTLAGTVLLLIALYAVVGIIYGVRFLLVTAPKLDDAMRAAPLRVRVLFFPGAIAIWPVLLRRAAQLRRSSAEAA